MVRFVALCFLFGSVTLMAQVEIIDRALMEQTVCGPVGLQARMLDTSQDSPIVRQRVGIVLHNLNAAPIVLERITFHFAGETATSGAPLTLEIREEVGGREQASFGEQFSAQNPVSYVELNSVKYADGTTWNPGNGTVCKIAPSGLKN
jgi:hypothetical protein